MPMNNSGTQLKSLLDRFEQEISCALLSDSQLINKAALVLKASEEYFQQLSTCSDNFNTALICELTMIGCSLVVSSIEQKYIIVTCAGTPYLIYWGDVSPKILTAVTSYSLVDGIKKILLETIMVIIVKKIDSVCYNPIKFKFIKNAIEKENIAN